MFENAVKRKSSAKGKEVTRRRRELRSESCYK